MESLDDAVSLFTSKLGNKDLDLKSNRIRAPYVHRQCICIMGFIISLAIVPFLLLILVRSLEQKPVFYHLPFIENLNCGLVFEDSHKGLKYRENLAKYRIIYKDEGSLKTDCDSIKSRGYFPKTALTKDEENFPIAFARIVYKDYYFLESQLRVEYAPQNVFCYLLDSKADKLFKKRIRNLGKCFDNVIVPEEEIDVRSEGHNMTVAHLTCLNHLRSYRWKYVILLQNHDIKLKTNGELVKILKIFNGANDISASKPGIHTFASEANWTLAALKLFQNKELNTLHPLNITKSLVQVSISREAVDYVLDELDVGLFIKQLELKDFGVDELFWATLNTDQVINLPGGFTRECLTQNDQIYMTTRFTAWMREKKPIIPCKSSFFRRWVCVFGVEDLPNLVHVHQLYANKLLSEFDFAAVTCLLEHVYNRTYFPTENSFFNLEKYSQLPHIRFYNQKMKNQINDFNCSESSGLPYE